MNAVLLADLKEPLTVLPGVGPVAAKRLSRLGLETIGHLLEHFPKAYEDRRVITPLHDIIPGAPVVIEARVIGHNWSGQRRSYLSIELSTLHRKIAKHLPPTCGLRLLTTNQTVGPKDSRFHDDSLDAISALSDGDQKTISNERKRQSERESEMSSRVRTYEKIELFCFGRLFLSRSLSIGTSVVIAATFEERDRRLVATNFEIRGSSDNASFDRVVPIYSLTEGVRPSMLRRTMLSACAHLYEFESPWDAFCRARDFLSIASAVRALHFPENYVEMKRARTSIAYAELLQLQVFLRKRRPLIRGVRQFGGKLKHRVTGGLSFSLTDDQQQALEEIMSGLQSKSSTSRLLQGDVGCGKTLVAFLAATCVIESGQQVALVVPTELLAVQHANTAAKILSPYGISVALLTASSLSYQGVHLSDRRKNLLKSLKNGKIDLIVGTHALLQGDVKFQNLGLVIIDEQHRFGVLQRRHLLGNSPCADLLLMTATPIPRSLALTVYGDLELSVIRSLPPGRSMVSTFVTSFDNLSVVFERVRSELSSGGQVYFVVPRIGQAKTVSDDENCLSTGNISCTSEDTLIFYQNENLTGEATDYIPDVFSVFRSLTTKVFPEFSIGMIHGSMKEQKKRLAMEAFRNKKLSVLVATTVIEVGIDVSEASAIVILGAEQLGLSTLHQLRGRVGRGSRPGFAFLVHGHSLSSGGKARLHVMEESNDGFHIAERDLKNRGPGELIGLRQAGLPRFCVANLVRDSGLASQARDDARIAVSDVLEKSIGQE